VEGERLFEEGRQTFDEIRKILGRGEGEGFELPGCLPLTDR
jgi:hypothetical protein